jgi:putative transposase
MSKPPHDRTSFGSNVYFVTASTWGHRSLFQTERMAGLFIETIFHYRRQRKFLIHEFVVMPTHFHLLLTPTGIALERAMQFIKGGFSYRVKKDLSLSVEVWERGYVDHRIRDAIDYSRHVEYIRQNPVEARIVERAGDYPYSSAHNGFAVDSCPEELECQSSSLSLP